MKVENARPPLSRVVVDTNFWLSAALSPRGTPAKAIAQVLASGIAVFSEATFAELQNRIWKPKFDRYLTMEVRQGILHDARAYGLWVEVPEATSSHRFSREGDDDKSIHTALTASAAWLVTGDQDQLVIEGDIGVRIVTPADALMREDFCR
jgi:putative PIN family toxin of toxin-antitoxin system